MQCTGLFKRIIPFVLTFAFGLFVASFFVSIALPTINLESGRGCRESQQLRRENDELRDRLRVLRQQHKDLKLQSESWSADSEALGVPPLIGDEHKPEPPPPPRKPHFGTIR